MTKEVSIKGWGEITADTLLPQPTAVRGKTAAQSYVFKNRDTFESEKTSVNQRDCPHVPMSLRDNAMITWFAVMPTCTSMRCSGRIVSLQDVHRVRGELARLGISKAVAGSSPADDSRYRSWSVRTTRDLKEEMPRSIGTVTLLLHLTCVRLLHALQSSISISISISQTRAGRNIVAQGMNRGKK